ncbi:bifunctional protein-serine/threonine kinase/phosphatase [Salipiger sp. 1_MG-2023]|uniref:bifunctional protein-serine/threonine kinase/phosphatase n=1 Tax=Salipiger sp. 1_MG-2023 TaxID=3062665 RepID=UPI0026E1C178|nr:bifunctional protein-serine/threonine kinase/phosphatase [Salipiger sp. 1_MG-2023]MDO6584861.1 bifunctional protein-serine/threonine kinase/phosphatase [Salipiger sp. 1_MG-2023]
MPRDMMTDRLEAVIGQCASAGRKPLMQDFHGARVPEGDALMLKGIVLAVADGISSSQTSGVAAQSAVRMLLSDYYDTPDGWTVKTAASRVLQSANAWLYGQNRTLADLDSGMVCAFAALILKGGAGHVLHAGDARVARFADGLLDPLTVDHRSGEMLARALGAAETVALDYRRVPLRAGDVFVLSTDGLYEHISGADVAHALTLPTLNDACRALVDTALSRGSADNLTVQIVQVIRLPQEAGLPETAALPVPLLPKPGDTLDGLRVLRTLSQTPRSHVFLAADPNGRKIVLKIPASETLENPAALRRFTLEEWVARRVSSVHVMQAADVPQPRSGLYVAMAYLPGRTLRQWMTDHPGAPLDKMRDIAGQIISGLRALHRREMIHQDIRPENILIDEDGSVRIIDLGSVSVAGVEEAAPGLLGELPGTLQYTAPEYLSGDVVSWRSDQYALAVILYEMLTGRLPYGAQVARIATRADQRRLQYAPARSDDSTVPAFVDAALRRALHPDPLRRYNALSEFLADLHRPGSAARAAHHIPLAARDPLRFWQALTIILAVICVILAAQLAG